MLSLWINPCLFCAWGLLEVFLYPNKRQQLSIAVLVQFCTSELAMHGLRFSSQNNLRANTEQPHFSFNLNISWQIPFLFQIKSWGFLTTLWCSYLPEKAQCCFQAHKLLLFWHLQRSYLIIFLAVDKNSRFWNSKSWIFRLLMTIFCACFYIQYLVRQRIVYRFATQSRLSNPPQGYFSGW